MQLFYKRLVVRLGEQLIYPKSDETGPVDVLYIVVSSYFLFLRVAVRSTWFGSSSKSSETRSSFNVDNFSARKESIY